MKPSSGGSRRLARLAERPLDGHVCLSCQRTITRRRYASAAAAAVATEDEPANVTAPAPTNSATPIMRPKYQMHAGVLLSRAPVITRDLHPFEKAYFLYQRRLNERLALPFTRYFYIKKGTPADVEWKRKYKERLTPAREIGVYNAYGKEGWNDELLVDSTLSETSEQMEALLRDAEVPATGGTAEADKEVGVAQVASKTVPVERPMSRVTEADRNGDLTSLDRLLQRHLYLLVKNERGHWRLPNAELIEGEPIHRGAERVVVQACGPNMNTWIIGKAPIGHFVQDYMKPVQDAEHGTVAVGEKVFFMKGRIMAGQADLKAGKLGIQDFRWLAKEEIQPLVWPKYWRMIERMLV